MSEYQLSGRHGLTGALCLLIIALTACDRPSNKPTQVSDKIVHPTPENIPADSAVADIIEMASDIQGEGELHSYARRLRAADKTMTIGAVDGDRYEMIGKVADVAGDESGTIYLLDSRYNEVRLYSDQGVFIRAFGGPGRGPEGFLAPSALERAHKGWLVIADRNGVIKTFAFGDTSFMHRATISLKFTPAGLCTMNGVIYVRGVGLAETGEGQEIRAIHVFSKRGEKMRSFGQPYKSENTLVQSQLSGGPVACSMTAQTLVTAYTNLPVLFGYAPGGKLKWTSKLADFKPMKMVEKVNEQGQAVLSYKPAPPSQGKESDLIVNMVATPGGKVIVQVSRRTMESIKARKLYAKLHTYLIDAATGEGVYVGDDLPPIYDVTAGRIYAGVNNPFPKIIVYRLPAEST